jgi:hypothetical protein
MLILMAAVLPACAAKNAGPLTSIRAAWLEPEHRGQPLGKLLVLGLAQRLDLKQQFEDTFARELQARGVDAVSAFSIAPSVDKMREPELRGMVGKGGFDHILVTRLVGVRRQQDYSSGAAFFEPYPWYGGFYRYYGQAWDQVHTPERLDNEVVTLETNLYRTSDDDLVWSANSDTFKSASAGELIESISREAAIELIR